ncbi:MAG TPA: hypothetical protein VMQ93_03710 [Novosphingobium sp.]|nr:hypothetical protein [Novosphingobium sp.]
MNDPKLYARDLLRIAVDLLGDEESLAAAAMISGAIEVLDGRAEPATPVSAMSWKIAHRHATPVTCRSCA